MEEFHTWLTEFLPPLAPTKLWNLHPAVWTSSVSCGVCMHCRRLHNLEVFHCSAEGSRSALYTQVKYLKFSNYCGVNITVLNIYHWIKNRNSYDSAPLNVQYFCWHEMTGNSSTGFQTLCQLTRRRTRVFTPHLSGCVGSVLRSHPAPPLFPHSHFESLSGEETTPFTGKAATARCHTNRRFVMTSYHFPHPLPFETHTHTHVTVCFL